MQDIVVSLGNLCRERSIKGEQFCPDPLTLEFILLFILIFVRFQHE